VEECIALGTDNMEVIERYAKAIGTKKSKADKSDKGKDTKGGEGGEEEEEFTPDSGTGKGESDDLKLDEDEQENISPGELARRMKKRNPNLLT